MKKVASVAFVFELFAAGLIWNRVLGMRERVAVQSRKMVFFVFDPVKRGCDARACQENIRDKNRQQQIH